MQEEAPSYYAIIPADVRYSDIPANAKLLYGEITALTNKEGFCWASNKYFAELYGKSTSTISVWISHLVSKGFITSIIEDNYRRKIYITHIMKNRKGVNEKSLTPLLEKSKTPFRKISNPLLEKSQYSNTVNNTSNNTREKEKSPFQKKEIVLTSAKPLKEVSDIMLELPKYYGVQLLPKTQKQRDIWTKVLSDLLFLDNYSKEDILKAIIKARKDTFWGSRFLSISKLRKTNTDDVRYIDVFLNLKDKPANNKPVNYTQVKNNFSY